MGQPFRDESLVAVAPSGSGVAVVHAPAATSSRGTFEIQVFSDDGILRKKHLIGYSALPLTDAIVSKLAAEMLSNFDASKVPVEARAAVQREIRAPFYRPKYLPTATAATLGADGSLMLRRENNGAKWARWSWISANGAVIGDFYLDARSKILSASNGSIWVLALGELDVQQIVQYRVLSSTR
jgi:hypothetical protein